MIPDPADYLVVAMTALYRLYLAADAGRLVVLGLSDARVNGDEVVAARNRIVEHEFKMAVLHLQHARVVASISLRSAFMLRFLSPSALVASCRHYSTTCRLCHRQRRQQFQERRQTWMVPHTGMADGLYGKGGESGGAKPMPSMD